MSEQPVVRVISQTATWAVLDKSAGLIIHTLSPRATPRRPEASGEGLTRYGDVPGQKHIGTTLVDWLHANLPAIRENFPDDDARPGIVHRLDADTSGVILVAKDAETLRQLQDQFRSRSVEKVYQALVLGDPGPTGTLSGAIGRAGEDTRHAVRHLSFSWDKGKIKPAETNYRVLSQFLVQPLGSNQEHQVVSLIELQPKTGRTHQLRVQLLDHGTPIIGDPMYSTKASREVSERLGLHRQFLHAASLRFTDPATDQRVTVTSPLARDLQTVLDRLGSEQ